MHARAKRRHVFVGDELDERCSVFIEIRRGKHQKQRFEASEGRRVDFGIGVFGNFHNVANRAARAEFDQHGTAHVHTDHIGGNHVGIQAVKRLGLYVQN